MEEEAESETGKMNAQRKVQKLKSGVTNKNNGKNSAKNDKENSKNKKEQKE